MISIPHMTVAYGYRQVVLTVSAAGILALCSRIRWTRGRASADRCGGRPVVTRDEDQNFTETATPRRPSRNSGEMLTWLPPPGFS